MAKTTKTTATEVRTAQARTAATAFPAVWLWGEPGPYGRRQINPLHICTVEPWGNDNQTRVALVNGDRTVINAPPEQVIAVINAWNKIE